MRRIRNFFIFHFPVLASLSETDVALSLWPLSGFPWKFLFLDGTARLFVMFAQISSALRDSLAICFNHTSSVDN